MMKIDRSLLKFDDLNCRISYMDRYHIKISRENIEDLRFHGYGIDVIMTSIEDDIIYMIWEDRDRKIDYLING